MPEAQKTCIIPFHSEDVEEMMKQLLTYQGCKTSFVRSNEVIESSTSALLPESDIRMNMKIKANWKQANNGSELTINVSSDVAGSEPVCVKKVNEMMEIAIANRFNPPFEAICKVDSVGR